MEVRLGHGTLDGLEDFLHGDNPLEVIVRVDNTTAVGGQEASAHTRRQVESVAPFDRRVRQIGDGLTQEITLGNTAGRSKRLQFLLALMLSKVVADEREQFVDDERQGFEDGSKEIVTGGFTVDADETRATERIVAVTTERGQEEHASRLRVRGHRLQLREVIEESSLMRPVQNACTATVKRVHEMNVVRRLGQIRMRDQWIDAIGARADLTREDIDERTGTQCEQTFTRFGDTLTEHAGLNIADDRCNRYGTTFEGGRNHESSS